MKVTPSVRALGIALLVPLLAAGCAAQRQQEAREAIQARVAQCAALYPPGSHYLDRTKCEEPVRRTSMRVLGIYADLQDAWLANRAQIAAEMDAGHLTKEQANVRMSEVAMRLNQVKGERDQAASERRAMLAAAILSSRPEPYQPSAYQMQFSPPYQPAVRLQTTCNRIGSTTFCN